MSYKYKQLADYIKEDIVNNYVENDKYLSNRELQKKFDTSSLTVAKALEIVISEGYLRPVLGIGMFVTIPVNTVKLVNYLIVYDRDIHAADFSEKAYNAILKSNTNRNLSFAFAYYSDLKNNPKYFIDGIIFLSPTFKHYNLINSFANKDIPTIVFADHSPEIKTPTIDGNIEVACEDILKDIKLKGRKKISLITSKKINRYHTLLRTNYFKEYAEKYNIELNEKDIFYSNYDAFTYEDKENFMKIMDKKDHPDVIVFDSYYLCYSAILDLITEMSIKIGKDVFIYGFDEVNSNYLLDNKISYIKQPIEEEAKMAVEILEKQRGKLIFEKNAKLPCKFILAKD